MLSFDWSVCVMFYYFTKGAIWPLYVESALKTNQPINQTSFFAPKSHGTALFFDLWLMSVLLLMPVIISNRPSAVLLLDFQWKLSKPLRTVFSYWKNTLLFKRKWFGLCMISCCRIFLFQSYILLCLFSCLFGLLQFLFCILFCRTCCVNGLQMYGISWWYNVSYWFISLCVCVCVICRHMSC